jgi:uncharacterized protein
MARSHFTNRLLDFGVLAVAIVIGVVVINNISRLPDQTSAAETDNATTAADDSITAESDATQPTIEAIFTTNTGSYAFQLEIANTEAERAKGLMFRRSLGERSGMLFVFPSERHLNFWMQETYISLDIIFLDAELNVIKVHQQAKPLQTQEQYPSGEQAMYAVELNGGMAAGINLNVGDQLAVDLDTISDV